jgi:hypothetical protein
MAVHAPLSEIIQGRLLTDRSMQAADVVADLAGVALGVLVASRLHRPGDVEVDSVD